MLEATSTNTVIVLIVLNFSSKLGAYIGRYRQKKRMKM